ncbi:MAG: acyl-CoA dehydrogenase C-terminal domain-containing protein [Myxococcota bacterium]|nr:acyl-CoA dehydrogenase C-terminal domain-containing protein [Myxococcota bacterium]
MGRDYTPPVSEMLFVLEHLVDLDGLAVLSGRRHADLATAAAVLEEAAKLFGEQMAETSRSADAEGCRLERDSVRLPDVMRAAHRRIVDGDWTGLPFPSSFGGAAFPACVTAAVDEMMAAANPSLSLLTRLTRDATSLLLDHASEEQKWRYLPGLVSGEWSATLCLSEPQAGSDGGQVRTRAERQPDGSYRLFGTKTFVSFGAHDLTRNVVHLVLARTPEAPAGTRGLSLFIVPKRLVGDDGRLGARNDVRCVSLERKLDLHASPTCRLSFGDSGEGAVGDLVGEEFQGLRPMFTLMSRARLGVGLSGLATAERAYQQAVAHAKERRQGHAIAGDGAEPVPTLRHPDVRRMLMTMRCQIDAMRALVYVTAALIDRAREHPGAAASHAAQQRADLLAPIVETWCTDVGSKVTSLAMQVFGGMGYAQETGIAQLFRDARIGPIGAGTSGIQALDPIGRKLARDGGATIGTLIEEVKAATASLPRAGVATQGRAADLGAIRRELEPAVAAVEAATRWILEKRASEPESAGAGATPYLRLLGTVAGAHLLALSARRASDLLADPDLYGRRAASLRAKIASARFYAEQILPTATALLGPITRGKHAFFAIPDEDWSV